jgi:rhodanese-related sulfurtransferase
VLRERRTLCQRHRHAQEIDRLFNLRGGMYEWEKAGQPIDRGRHKEKGKKK